MNDALRRTLIATIGPMRISRLGQSLLHAYRARQDPQFAALLRQGTREQRFAYMYASNKWGNAESRSGNGSSLHATSKMRRDLETLLVEEDVKSIFDAGCGDFNWMSRVAFIGDYTGGDIVPALVENLNRTWGSERRHFITFDAVTDTPPVVDLVICREVLFHLPNWDVSATLRNFVRSGSRLLLVTTDVSAGTNWDVEAGAHRPLNLSKPPFNLPAPRRVIEDDRISRHQQLALYDMSTIAAII
jgi:SAM-dependent methyltransferase